MQPQLSTFVITQYNYIIINNKSDLQYQTRFFYRNVLYHDDYDVVCNHVCEGRGGVINLGQHVNNEIKLK